MGIIDPWKFARRVCNGCRAAFADVRDANPDQHFYAFGLYTDDSLQSLHPVANTEEGLAATVEHYHKTSDYKPTIEDMRWSFGDWKFFPDVGGGYFDDINQELSQNFDKMLDDEDYDGDIPQLWEAVEDGLLRLEEEAYFGTGAARSKITLMILGDLPDELLDEFVKSLNPPDVFERWMQGAQGSADD